VFDKSRKAVVTVKEAVISSTKPVEPIAKKKELQWITIENDNGEYTVVMQRTVNGEVVGSKRIAAIDLDDAVMMFEQYAQDYIIERRGFKND